MLNFKRNEPKEDIINTTVSIALLLLVFFIISSSVHTNKDVSYRRFNLPNENQVNLRGISQRNILLVTLDNKDALFLNGQQIERYQLKDITKEFIDNPDNELDKPEKTEQVISFFGPMLITSKHIIVFQYDRNTSYNAYISTRNELVSAYRDLRDELAKRKWQKKYTNLTLDEKKAIRQIYPFSISEIVSKK